MQSCCGIDFQGISFGSRLRLRCCSSSAPHHSQPTPSSDQHRVNKADEPLRSMQLQLRTLENSVKNLLNYRHTRVARPRSRTEGSAGDGASVPTIMQAGEWRLSRPAHNVIFRRSCSAVAACHGVGQVLSCSSSSSSGAERRRHGVNVVTLGPVLLI